MVPYRFLHFIGALTASMASLAMYAHAAGCKVTASDDHGDTLYAPEFKKAGITLFDMYAQTNIHQSLDAVVVSRYLDERHPEVMVARNRNLPVMSETEFLQQVSESTQKIGILGEYESPLVATWLHHVWQHGRMSTSGLTDTVPAQADLTPVLAVNGETEWFTAPLLGLKRAGGVYEPDFLAINVDIALIPAMYYDHPDLYSTLDEAYSAYYTIAKRVPRKGVIVGNSDYPRMKRLRAHLVDRHIETYGFERDAMWHIREVTLTDEGTSFSLAYNGSMYGPFTIPHYGETAVTAAAAVAVISLLQDMKISTLGEGLATLPALKRYLETSTDREGRILIRDSADHPETIARVFQAVKEKYPTKKIWCVYEPCSFMRIKSFMADYVPVLQSAENCYIADIHGYPKEKSEGMHARHFVAELKAHHPHVMYASEASELALLLRDRVPSTDVIVMLGADPVADTIISTLCPEQVSNPDEEL